MEPGAFQWLSGDTFGDDAAQAVQVHNRGELDTIAEGSARSDDRIGKAESAHLDAEVDLLGIGIHAT